MNPKGHSIMNDEIIPDFNALCRFAERKKLSAEAEKYIARTYRARGRLGLLQFCDKDR